MGSAIIGSKEVAIAILTFILGNVVAATGVEFPLTPEQIYSTGLAIMAIVRILWTNEKITKIIPE